MKDTFTDASTSAAPPAPLRPPALTRPPPAADFPRTADQRVYHVGIRAGEVANRIVSYQDEPARCSD